MDAFQRAVEGSHAARRAVTEAVTEDYGAAIMTIAAARDPEGVACVLLGIVTGMIQYAAKATGEPPAELWQRYALGLARQNGH